MDLNLSTLKRDAQGLEYLLVGTGDLTCLSVQGTAEDEKRIRRGFRSAERFGAAASGIVLEPVSCEGREGMVSAVYKSGPVQLLSEKLDEGDALFEYTLGKSAGRALHALHALPLAPDEGEQAARRQRQCLDKLKEYVEELPHLLRDQAAVSAVSRRSDHLRLYKPVYRYGAVRIDNMLLMADQSLRFLPSASFGPGDVSEDFVLMECEDAACHPFFCAGAIDGYFAGRIPAQFWLQYTLQCALYSLWRTARHIRRDEISREDMQEQCDRIREDFADFTHPQPRWFKSAEVAAVREEARRRGR